MGYDATITLKSAIKQEIFNSLCNTLHIQKANSNTYFCIDPFDYEMHQPVVIFLEKGNGKISHISLRLQIWANYYEKLKFNNLLKVLSKQLDGDFVTDNGKNKLLILKGALKISKAEAGCYYAYDDLESAINSLQYFINNISEFQNEKDLLKVIGDVALPSIFSAHMAEIYMVTLIETYFRSVYTALLKYSENKENVLKNQRIRDEDIIDITNGKISVEEAFALSKNFQNLRRICDSFNELDKNIKLEKFLKENKFYDKLNVVINTRHKLIHRNIYNFSKNKQQARKDLLLIKKCFLAFNLHLCSIYHWDKTNFKEI